jgi:hypothetical protein
MGESENYGELPYPSQRGDRDGVLSTIYYRKRCCNAQLIKPNHILLNAKDPLGDVESGY